jgi:hypothetical protein
MVRESGRHQGDNQQGRKFCDAYFQSGFDITDVAGRRWQADACVRVDSKSG